MEHPTVRAVANTPLRVGIIGIGFGQAAHLPAFRAVPGCTVAAIAASSPDRARAVAARHAVPTWHGNWRELVERGDIDIVSLAVPPALQTEIGIAAARGGKHLFCEKPLAPTVEAAAALVEAARSAGVRHAVDFEFPELPQWREAGRMVRSGELGAVRELRIAWSTRAGAHRRPRSRWKEEDELGGGVLGGFVSHALHYATWLVGTLEVVESRLTRSTDVITACNAILTGQAGTFVSIAIDNATTHEPLHSVEVTGTKGSLSLLNEAIDHGGPFALRVGDQTREVPSDGEIAADRRAPAVARIARRFVEAIRTGAPMCPDLRDGQESVRLLDAIRVAARRRS
ncbi:MAG TPA: Gfo/Idh/MocA family oxidoreductase [Vicinamibacterales bacterium]|nr:Gfo/Idh/MocA family oxidoreductase [Vicinamibacterales bacterium]